MGSGCRHRKYDQQHSTPSHHLILLAKFPSIGTAKTRLIPRLGPSGSSSFALAALTDTLHHFSSLPAHKTLFYTPPTARPALLSLLDAESLISWHIQPQSGTDLGSRIAAALDQTRSSLATDEKGNANASVAFIGMDCFELRVNHVERSFAVADTGLPFMLPATDGGYVLLTVPSTCPATVFDGIPWSCERTARVQIGRLEEARLECVVGEVLDDVDEPADLDRLWMGRGTKILTHPRTMRFLETVYGSDPTIMDPI
jgi:glycosyltransferase A (GT-A) superfamily protein (DUF2064 family)